MPPEAFETGRARACSDVSAAPVPVCAAPLGGPRSGNRVACPSPVPQDLAVPTASSERSVLKARGQWVSEEP